MALLRVIVDIDGVLANYNAGIAKIAKAIYGVELPENPREITDWHQCSNMLGNLRWAMVWDMATRNPQFLIDLPPLASPQEFALIESLNLVGDVYFVTHRLAFGSKAITEQWLMDHGISAPTVILSGEKGLMAKAVQATFVIEDSAANIKAILEQSPETKTYLMEYPYNAEVAPLVYRSVKSVAEFARDVLAA
jgi:hypothetical protein